MKLIRLIQSLSKSEKRFFKLQNNAIGNKNKTSNLIFDLINKEQVLDSKALSSKINTKYYSTAQKTLYENILNSLLNYNHENKSTYTKLNQELCKINILFERNLLKEALHRSKILIKNKSSQLDKKNLLSVYLLCQKILIKIRLIDRNHTPELLELNQKIIALYDYLTQLSIYEDIIIQIGYAQNKGKSSLQNTNKQLRTIVENQSILQKNKEAIHPDLITIHYSILSRYYAILGENELCMDTIMPVITDIKKNKDYVVDKEYIYIVAGYLDSCFRLNKMQAFKENYEGILLHFKETLAKRFVSVFIHYVEAVVISVFPDWELQEIQRIEQYLLDYRDQLHVNDIGYIQYRLAEIYFLIEDFDKTIAFLESVIDSKGNKMLALFYPEGLYLMILSYLEIGTSSLTLRYINALKYYIRSQNNVNALQPDMLNLLKQLYNNWDNKQNLNDLFKKMQLLCNKPDFKETLHSKALERYIFKRISKK